MRKAIIVAALLALSLPAHAVETVTVTIGAQSTQFTFPDGTLARMITYGRAKYQQPGQTLTNAQILKAVFKDALRSVAVGMWDQDRATALSTIPDPVDPQ